MDENEYFYDVIAEFREYAMNYVKDKDIALNLEKYCDRLEKSADMLIKDSYNDGYEDRCCNG